MSIQLYFNETNIRFVLSIEDAKRLLKHEINKHTPCALFVNYDFREEALCRFNTVGCVTRYIIAFSGKDYCIVGDENLGAIWPYTHFHNGYKIGCDDSIDPRFSLWRLQVGMPQEWEF